MAQIWRGHVNSRREPRQYGGVPPDYEYAPLRLPPGTDRVSAQVELTIRAEYGGWELARVRLYPDGTRKVVLRRRRSASNPAPQLAT
jgi:hypothetical protein